MTTPPEEITVECSGCGHIYRDWYRASLNLDLDDFDDAYIEEASTATCPSCGHKVAISNLIGEDLAREPAMGNITSCNCISYGQIAIRAATLVRRS